MASAPDRVPPLRRRSRRCTPFRTTHLRRRRVPRAAGTSAGPRRYELDRDAPDRAAARSPARAAQRSSDAALRPRLEADGDEPRQQELWGGETHKAVENFPVSGEPIPAPVARWLGRIKAAAARVNGELGLLDADKAERIAAAADRIANGELDDQFPIDVFQTGSGTSSNMNANEVIANARRRGRPRERRRQHGPVVERRLPDRRAPRCARRADATTCFPRSTGSRPRWRPRRRSSTTWSSRAARTGWTRCRSRSARSSAATRPRCARASRA